MTTRTCKTCGIEYPLTREHFQRTNTAFYRECKTCQNADARRRYRAMVERFTPERAASRERARAVVVEFRASLNQGD